MAECKDLVPEFCGATRQPFTDFCKEEEDGRTILWSDGMLTLNMTDEQIQQYIEEYELTIVKRYRTYTEDNPYDVTVNIEYDDSIGADVITSVYGQPWDNEREQITLVELNGVHPKSIKGWFYGTTNLREFSEDLQGCTNIVASFAESGTEWIEIRSQWTGDDDDDYITDASYAFQNCKNTNQVTLCYMFPNKLEKCVQMFYGCSKENFGIQSYNFPQTADGRQMFEGCINIVGCTPYDPDHVGIEYAVDDDTCNPGQSFWPGPGYFGYCD